MVQEYKNVIEPVTLYDTVGIYKSVDSLVTRPNPAGWFESYQDLGNANEISFFNVRNRSDGEYYTNSDKRDQVAWAFWLESIGLAFWSAPITCAESFSTDFTFSPEDHAAQIFCIDLPRYVSVTLRIRTDDVLKTHAYFCPPGYGPFGDGYGRGSPSAMTTLLHDDGWDHHLSVMTQGTPELPYRLNFPTNIAIPRDANLSVTLKYNEAGKKILQNLPWQTTWQGSNLGVRAVDNFAGIQVTLKGNRGVQQRGEYFR